MMGPVVADLFIHSKFLWKIERMCFSASTGALFGHQNTRFIVSFFNTLYRLRRLHNGLLRAVANS